MMGRTRRQLIIIEMVLSREQIYGQQKLISRIKIIRSLTILVEKTGGAVFTYTCSATPWKSGYKDCVDNDDSDDDNNGED